MSASIASIQVIAQVSSKDSPSIQRLAIVDHLPILDVVVMGITSEVHWNVATNASNRVRVIDLSISFLIMIREIKILSDINHIESKRFLPIC